MFSLHDQRVTRLFPSIYHYNNNNLLFYIILYYTSNPWSIMIELYILIF